MGWVLGAVINVLGSLCINGGTNIIKAGHRRLAEAAKLGAPPPPALLRAPRAWWAHPGGGPRVWLLGFALFSAGNAANFVSFAFAAQSLLAALGSIQFVSNLAFARALNGEPVRRRAAAATGLIIGGCVLIAAYASHESPVLTAADLRALYGGAAYIAYLSAAGALAAGAYVGHRAARRRAAAAAARGGPPSRADRAAAAAQPALYAAYAGAVGTQGVLYGKSGSLLVRASLGGASQAGEWYTYAVAALFVVFASFWVTRFNAGVRDYPVSVIMPVLQVSWVLFSMLAGVCYFQEYRGMSAAGAGAFAAGAGVLLAGVVLLSSGRRPAAGDAAPAAAPAAEVAAAPADVEARLPAVAEGGEGGAAAAAAAGGASAGAPPPPPAARRVLARLELDIDFVGAWRGVSGQWAGDALAPPTPFAVPALDAATEAALAAGAGADAAAAAARERARRRRTASTPPGVQLVGVQVRAGPAAAAPPPPPGGVARSKSVGG